MTARPLSNTPKVFAAIALGVFLGIGTIDALGYMYLATPSFSRNQTWYTRVAAEVAAGKLVPDAQGVVRLDQAAPRGASGFTIGEAYVHGTPAPTGGTWTLFIPHWRGKGSNVEGYLYSPAAVRQSAPAVWPHFTGGGFAPATGELVIERSLGGGWHLTAYRAD